MTSLDHLTEEYALWLQEDCRRSANNILGSFRRLAENCHRKQKKIDYKDLYITTHVAFLSQIISTPQHSKRPQFPMGIILLNFVLQQKPKTRIQLTEGMLIGFRMFFRESHPINCGGGLLGNVLWLVCKGIQGSSDKRAALQRLAESGLIRDFLEHGELDWQGEKAIAMLLYFTSKQPENREAVLSLMLEHQGKFKHPEGVNYVLATLKEAKVRTLRGREDLRGKLGEFLVRYMWMEEVPFSEKLTNIELIASVVYRQRELLIPLRVAEIIEQKLSFPLSDDDPHMMSLMRLLVASAKGDPAIGHILQLAIPSLTYNAAARRVFILFHEYMAEPQLIELLGNVPCTVERLLGSEQGRENGLKVLICLKRAAGRLGLNRVFWCTCRRVARQSLSLRSLPVLSLSCVELLELFEEIIKQEIEFLPIF